MLQDYRYTSLRAKTAHNLTRSPAHVIFFPGKYYFHHFGGDPDTARKLWGEHAFYGATARWCELYDQASFDPTYPNLPLTIFEPILKRVLAKLPYWWDPKHPKRFAVTGAA